MNPHGGHWPEPRVGPCPPASKGPSPELAAPSVSSWQEPWLGQVLPDPPGEVGVLFLNTLPSPATSWPQRGHGHHQPQHFNSWSRSQENGKTDLRESLPQVANITRPGAQDPSQDGLGDSETGSTPRSMLWQVDTRSTEPEPRLGQNPGLSLGPSPSPGTAPLKKRTRHEPPQGSPAQSLQPNWAGSW